MEHIPDVPKKLALHWFEIQGKITEIRKQQWIIIHSAKFKFSGHIITITWRAKTPKSMLKKLWEKEEYVRSSVVRDELGIW
jgi:protein-arginine kinase activator protein McsA